MRVISPNSFFHLVWESISLVLVIYITLETPLRMSFLDIKVNHPIFWFDLLTDFFFFLDVIKRFYTGYYTDDLMCDCVLQPDRIWRHYLLTWFIPDIISCFPTDIVLLWSDRPLNPIARMLKLIKVLRLFRFRELFVSLEKKVKINFSPVVQQLSALFLVIFVVSHMTACFWFHIAGIKTFIHIHENLTGTVDLGSNWVTEYFGEEVSDRNTVFNVFTLYVTSLYWASSTLTSVGFGDVVATNSSERVFSSIVAFIGSFLTGYIISSTASAYARAYKAKNTFREQLDKIKAYVNYRSVPPKLAKRIIDYFTHYIYRHALFDEQAILQSLSLPIRTELSSFLFEDVLRVIPLFKSIDDPSFFTNLMMLLKPLSVAAGDLVFQENDIGTEMFFVVTGHLVASKENSPEFKQTFQPGNHFGELAVFSQKAIKRRKYTVTAIVYSDLFSLAEKDFKSVIKDFPEVKTQLKLLSEKQNMKLGEAFRTRLSSDTQTDTGFVTIPRHEYELLIQSLERSKNVMAELSRKLQANKKSV